MNSREEAYVLTKEPRPFKESKRQRFPSKKVMPKHIWKRRKVV